MGYPVRNSPVCGIKGFNGQIYDGVTGEVDVDLKFGPGGAVKKARFYVVPKCPSPLVGMQTIHDFGLVIHAGEHKISEEGSGLDLYSAAVSIKELARIIKKNLIEKDSEASEEGATSAPKNEGSKN